MMFGASSFITSNKGIFIYDFLKIQTIYYIFDKNQIANTH